MIYDKLIVALLSALATEREETTNATIARYLVTHIEDLDDVTVKGVASACNVGVGSVSRFCRETGFRGFDELRRALMEAGPSFELAPTDHAGFVGASIVQAERSVDKKMLRALVDDLRVYQKVFVCGMLKAQAAAVNLQVDLLMQGKLVHTSVSYAEQLGHIAAAARDEMVVVFSYTGSYFDAYDLSDSFARLDRPRVWMVTGTKRPQPEFVYGCLSFKSSHSQLAHPFQLEMIAALIAQEYARAMERTNDLPEHLR